MKTLILSCALKAAIATHSACAQVARATALFIATTKSMIVCPGTIKLLRAHTEDCHVGVPAEGEVFHPPR